MMMRGSWAYMEFLESYEGFATDILADRLRKAQSSWNYYYPTRSIEWAKDDLCAYVERNRSGPSSNGNGAVGTAHEDADNQSLVRPNAKRQGLMFEESPSIPYFTSRS